MRFLLAALLLGGCVYVETYHPDGRVERSISPGVVVAGPLKEGARSVQAAGAAWVGNGGVIGWLKLSEARMGDCGIAIVPSAEFQINKRMLKGATRC